MRSPRKQTMNVFVFTGLALGAWASMAAMMPKATMAAEATMAAADEPPATGVATSPADVPAPTPPPAPYSLPWQLRPAAAVNVVRSDTSVAFYDVAGSSGSTVATTLLGSYKVTPTLAPLVRAAFVRNNDPGETLDSGSAFVNPLLGLTYAPKLGNPALRGAGFVGVTVPIGQGGDAAPGMDETAAAVSKGIPARSAMDNALFAVNYLTAIAGADLAYVAGGFTAQIEATLLQLTRVRNEQFAPESSRTNLTAGAHAGYFVMKSLSMGAELRYQRWLSTPAFVEANSAARDTWTAGIGPRAHFKVDKTTWIRPGISYSRALDDPMDTASYHIVQIDVPVIF